MEPCAYTECHWTGPESEYSAHVAQCMHRLVGCQNEGCDWRGEYRTRERHIHECKRRLSSRPQMSQWASLRAQADRPVFVKEVCGPAYRLRQVTTPENEKVKEVVKFRRAAAAVQPPIPDDTALEWALQLSASEIDNREVSGDVCSVCLEAPSGLMACLPGCCHTFHVNCVKAMTSPMGSMSCAICRRQFLWEDVSLCDPRRPDCVTKKDGGAAPENQTAVQASESSPCEPKEDVKVRDAIVQGDGVRSHTEIGQLAVIPVHTWRALRRKPRLQLIRNVFSECDMDGDLRLNSHELYAFAVETGFDSGLDMWLEEYNAVCADYSADPASGLPETAFAAFLSDTSDTGCKCADEELTNMFARLKATRAWRQGITSEQQNLSDGYVGKKGLIGMDGSPVYQFQ